MKLFLTFIGICLVGCTSLTKQQCAKADWYEIGRVDGQMGVREDFWRAHQKSCGVKVAAHESAWQAGRAFGLEDYCKPESAYQAGAEGRPYRDVCEGESEPEFLKQLEKGEEIYRLKKKLWKAKAELNKQKDASGSVLPLVGGAMKLAEIATGESATAEQERRVEDLGDELYRREKSAPQGGLSFPSIREKMETKPVDLLRPGFGMLIGASIGFGVGHTFVGSYKTKGWKWTAIDSALFGALAIAGRKCEGASTASSETDSGSARVRNSTTQSNLASDSCSLALILGLGAGVVASRAWQATEIYHSASAAVSPYKVGLVPRTDGGGTLLASWEW